MSATLINFDYSGAAMRDQADRDRFEHHVRRAYPTYFANNSEFIPIPGPVWDKLPVFSRELVEYLRARNPTPVQIEVEHCQSFDVRSVHVTVTAVEVPGKAEPEPTIASCQIVFCDPFSGHPLKNGDLAIYQKVDMEARTILRLNPKLALGDARQLTSQLKAIVGPDYSVHVGTTRSADPAFAHRLNVTISLSVWPKEESKVEEKIVETPVVENKLPDPKPQEEQVVTLKNGTKVSRLVERYDLLPPNALAEVARVLGEGAEKYGDTNYLGADPHFHLNRMLRHANRWQRFGKREDLTHLATRALMLVEVVLEMEQRIQEGSGGNS